MIFSQQPLAYIICDHSRMVKIINHFKLKRNADFFVDCEELDEEAATVVRKLVEDTECPVVDFLGKCYVVAVTDIRQTIYKINIVKAEIKWG